MFEALLLAASLAVGVFIGAAGVGGVLLIPALMAFAHLAIHEAAATALFSFLFTGVLGTWLFMRRGSIAWRTSWPVCAGAFAFACAGAFAGMALPSRALTWIVAAVILGAGVHILWRRPPAQGGAGGRAVTGRALFGVGAAAGFGAGLSGAGGPLFSVPLMLALHFDPLVAVGTGQVVQIAAAASGSAGNWMHGTIRCDVALPVTVAELAGVAIGVWLAHKAGARQLRYAAAILCVVSAVAMVVRDIAA
ncbi:MAG TPA: sulfite exporter TauE/SafE family protein [Burkholderiales bacterium]|nr:sulfite exporter TauE/SafE family protein [Burkholderiales bacterium]